MSQAPDRLPGEEPTAANTPPAKKRRWPKRLVIAALSLLLLLAVAGVGVWYYLRSERFNRQVISQVQGALDERGMRAEIGGLGISWNAQTARLNDIKIYNKQTGQLIASLRRLELSVNVRDPFALKLRREVELKKLVLDGAEVFVEIDEQGRSNLDGITNPPSEEGRIKIDASALQAALNDARISYNDRQRKLAAELSKIYGNATPQGDALAVQAASGAGRVVYEGRELPTGNLDVLGRVTEKSAQLDKFNLASPALEAMIKGRVDDFTAQRYAFDVQAKVKLDEAGKLLTPDLALKGVGEVTGTVQGEGQKFGVRANVKSSDLRIATTQLRDVQVGQLTADGEGERVAFALNGARIGAAIVDRIRVNGIAAGQIKGLREPDRTTMNSPGATIASVTGPDLKLTSLRLNALTATFNDTGKFKLTANAVAPGGEIAKAQFSNATARATVENDAAVLNDVKAALFGGSVAGDVRVPLASRAATQIKATFTDLQTGQAAVVAGVKDLPVAGRISGTADLSVGSTLRSLNGTIRTRFEGTANEKAGDAIPLTGNIDITARNGFFNFDNVQLATDASQVNATGALSYNGESDLRVTLNSTRAEQLVQLLRSVEAARPYLESYEPQLFGDFKFDGRVTGNLSNPTISGDVSAASFGLRDAIIGSLSGRITASSDQVTVENGLVKEAGGEGSVKFNAAIPLAEGATGGRLEATIDRIDLATLMATAGAPNANQFITGLVSGQANITGLPSAPAGSAMVNLINGTVAGQPADVALATVRLDGRTATLDRLELKTPQSRIAATGSFNLDTYAFQAQGRADDVALSSLADALEFRSARVEGTADADFKVSGRLTQGAKTELDYDTLVVEATANGENVRVNGRAAGLLQLTARTSPGGRIDAELVTGILSTMPPPNATGGAQPSANGNQGPRTETIRASIELRRPGRPIRVETETITVDVAAVLAAFAPDLAGTFSGTVRARVDIAGPSMDDAGNFTFDRLRGGLTLTETNLAIGDNPVQITTPLQIALADSRITLPTTNITGQGVALTVGGTLGLKEDAAMNFAVSGTVELAQLPRFPGTPSDLDLGGQVRIDARASGPMAQPNLSGRVDLAGLTVSTGDIPIYFSDGAGSITLTGSELRLDRFSVKANFGTIDVAGAGKLEGLRFTEWNYTLRAANVDFSYQGLTATVSGNAQLTGTPQGQTLSGLFTVPEAEFAVPIELDNLAFGGGAGGFSAFGGAGLGGGLGGGGLASGLPIPPVALNVRIEARDSIVVRNPSINTVGSALLNLNGTLNNPDLNGRITFEGGQVKFRGQRYEITNGSLELPAGAVAQPQVNLLAESDISGYHVYLGLNGSIDDLTPILRTEPELSRTEILSLIATGRTESGTASREDLLYSGVGAAASLVSSGLISRPTEQLLGISKFQLDPIIRPNSNPAARLTIGQQLTRDLFVSYSTNLGTEQDQTAIAEYIFSNRFSALATYTQGGSSTRQGTRDNAFTIELRGRQRYSLGFKPEQVTTPGADPKDALTRLARPTLPSADVTVSPIKDVKLSKTRLRETIPVITQGFSRSLARTGERRLLEYLQEKGYFFAEVRYRCEPVSCTGDNLKVFYDVTPNAIYDLKDIRIEGTDLIDIGDVRGQLQSQEAHEFGNVPFLSSLPLVGGYARGLTSNERLRNDAETIRRTLVEMGYRNARVASRLAVKPEDDDLIVIFDVTAGEQAEVADVAVRGNTLITSKELFAQVPIKASDAFSYNRAQAAARQLTQLYAQRGYLEVGVELETVEMNNNSVLLLYNINEGARATTGDVQIAGLTKTKENYVRRYLDFKKGDLLTPAKLRQTQRDLYATNAFREVNIRTELVPGTPNGDGGEHKVTINLTEAKPLLFVYGLGYSTDDGARGLIELTDTNLFGTLDSGSLRLRGSRREQVAQLSFTDLRPFGTKFPTTVSAFYNRNNNLIPFLRQRIVDGKVERSPNDQSFGLNRFAAFIQTERKLNDTTALRFRYNLERAKLFNLEGIQETEVTRNERAIRLGMLSVGITRDTRDSAVNSTRGQLVSADYSLASSLLGGNESFNKFFATYQRYQTLGLGTPVLKNSTLAFSARIGLAGVYREADRNNDGVIDDTEKRLPISERFFTGGATTLRGFRFERAGPQAVLEPRANVPGELPTLVPLGGDALAVFNFELRYPLTQRFRLVPFYDLGNVFRRVSDIRYSGMTNTVGLGLRVNTPLGPIGVDYGFLLDPPSYVTATGAVLRQPRGALHIRFGQSF